MELSSEENSADQPAQDFAAPHVRFFDPFMFEDLHREVCWDGVGWGGMAWGVEERNTHVGGGGVEGGGGGGKEERQLAAVEWFFTVQQQCSTVV